MGSPMASLLATLLVVTVSLSLPSESTAKYEYSSPPPPKKSPPPPLPPYHYKSPPPPPPVHSPPPPPPTHPYKVQVSTTSSTGA
ncbi:hypothetical protein OIU78_012439 [Salix suchowensis]|nr:hypothetical protein OIU78_012439 [Salix suchowensis]